MNRFNLTAFTITRLTLTLWYTLLLFIILVFFSAFIYTLENEDVTRVVLERDYGTNPPKQLTQAETKQVILQISDLRYSLILNLILVDDLILLIGGMLSYFLAGKTLEPIQKTMQRQREFMADASHELRTPLAAIQIAGEVALRNNLKTKKDYRKVVEQTFRESSRMAKMVDELMLLSRTEPQLSQKEFKKIRLDKLIKEVMEETKPLLLQKKLKIKKIEINEAVINADRNKIKQLILIIFDNAIKFSPQKGIISIKAGRKPKPFFSITDNGIGIPRQEQRKIFYRFYQIDKSRSKSGSGLGLSIAKWIADMHKASIFIKSGQGKGSTFTVVFNS